MSIARPYSMSSTVEAARGRWREILPQLGVSPKYLTSRHGPCPLCGGKDRFRFDDRDGSGSYFCGRCGAGAGIILLRKLHKWSHRTACEQVDRILEPRVAPAVQPVCRSEAQRAAAVQRVLDEARDRHVVQLYLVRRGLTVESQVLRGNVRCAYFDNGDLKGHFPTIIAPITAPDGVLESVQKIVDADVTPRKKIMPPVRTIRALPSAYLNRLMSSP